MLSCLEDLFSQTDWKAVFRNQKKKNPYVFSNMEKLLPESDIRVQCVYIDLAGFVGADFCNMHSHTGCTRCQHVMLHE